MMKTPACFCFVGLLLAPIVFGKPDVLPAPVPSRAEISVIKVQFGLFNWDPTVGRVGRAVPFVSCSDVPLEPGVTYGWRFVAPPGRRAIHIREELELPAPAATWSSVNGATISADRRTAIIETDAMVVDGIAQHGWTVAADDPPGVYQMRLYVEGRLLLNISFRCVARPVTSPSRTSGR